jgi:hypothetical protein
MIQDERLFWSKTSEKTDCGDDHVQPVQSSLSQSRLGPATELDNHGG